VVTRRNALARTANSIPWLSGAAERADMHCCAPGLLHALLHEAKAHAECRGQYAPLRQRL